MPGRQRQMRIVLGPGTNFSLMASDLGAKILTFHVDISICMIYTSFNLGEFSAAPCLFTSAVPSSHRIRKGG
jgi:hypothetical protein